MIPQSDFQYAWITASTDRFDPALGAANNVYGYFPYDGLARVSGSEGFRYEAAVNFASASEVGSGNPSGGQSATRQIRLITSAQMIDGTFVPTDFAGINSNVIEPISASEFTIGYPLDASGMNYYNFGSFGEEPVLDAATAGGFITRINSSVAANFNAYFSMLIAHRGGNVGHPTWKQIRVGESQLARHYRKHNLYSHTFDPVVEASVLDSSNTRFKVSTNTESLLLTQSVVTDRYYPVIFDVEARDDEQNSNILKSSNFIIRASFVNNAITFETNSMVNRLTNINTVKAAIKKTPYKQIINDFSIYDSFLDEQKPILQINSMKYRETVYPAQANTYTNKVRGRKNYENNFWRDDRLDRTTKGASKKPTNSQGHVVDQSCWALDGLELTTNSAHDGSEFTRRGYPTGGVDANNISGYKPGELQNLYTHFVSSSLEEEITTALALYILENILCHSPLQSLVCLE